MRLSLPCTAFRTPRLRRLPLAVQPRRCHLAGRADGSGENAGGGIGNLGDRRSAPQRHQGAGAVGPGYSPSDKGLAPVPYPMTPSLNADSPLPRKDQKSARGLRLYETFVA